MQNSSSLYVRNRKKMILVLQRKSLSNILLKHKNVIKNIKNIVIFPPKSNLKRKYDNPLRI